MPLSQSDLEVLDDRLRNWGRWAADRTVPGSSYLWRAMKKYGERDKNSTCAAEDEVLPPVDELDALLVERAWVALAESPILYKQAKYVLAAHFCYPGLNVWRTAKLLQFSSKKYEQILKLGKCQIQNVLNRFDKLRELQENGHQKT